MFASGAFPVCCQRSDSLSTSPQATQTTVRLPSSMSNAADAQQLMSAAASSWSPIFPLIRQDITGALTGLGSLACLPWRAPYFPANNTLASANLGLARLALLKQQFASHFAGDFLHSPFGLPVSAVSKVDLGDGCLPLKRQRMLLDNRCPLCGIELTPDMVESHVMDEKEGVEVMLGMRTQPHQDAEPKQSETHESKVRHEAFLKIRSSRDQRWQKKCAMQYARTLSTSPAVPVSIRRTSVKAHERMLSQSPRRSTPRSVCSEQSRSEPSPDTTEKSDHVAVI